MGVSRPLCDFISGENLCYSAQSVILDQRSYTWLILTAPNCWMQRMHIFDDT